MKLRAYINGFVIGMLLEYLIRVEFHILPLIILIVFILIMLLDLVIGDKERKL